MIKFVAAFLLALTTTRGAVPADGTAPFLGHWQGRFADAVESFQLTHHAQNSRRRMSARRLPEPARFREDEAHGLLVKTWINDIGTFTFAIDTGAGASIISPRVAREAGVGIIANSSVSMGGLSGRRSSNGREAVVRTLAIGRQENYLPAKGLVIVSESLPDGLDGVLDPAECYWPLGFVLDFPAGEMSAFDPRRTPLRRAEAPPDGAIVAWLTDGASRRPYVALANRRRALIDSGSGFGLAVSLSAAQALGIAPIDARAREGVRDLARGQISAQRIAPATVQIGPLVLRSVPTDLLPSAPANAPVLLGRDALRPFQLSFDPLNKLIRFALQ